MTNKPENPPAFPSTSNKDFATRQEIPLGMTLRDYFAGQALMGMMSNRHEWFNSAATEASIDAYEIADAMLKARQP